MKLVPPSRAVRHAERFAPGAWSAGAAGQALAVWSGNAGPARRLENRGPVGGRGRFTRA
jgi:hypothetical protein